MTEHLTTATIEADPVVPLIHITRDFRATPAQVIRAHTDPELFVKWIGPNDRTMTIEHWDARTGGSWRYFDAGDDDLQAFRGCFHEIGENRIVQTFTWEGMPEGVSLETLTVTDLGDGWTRLHATSLVDSFEGRDAWLVSGMEIGVNDGYAKLDGLLSDGAL
ncbi:MAG: SRPBCC domain-containing protein [Micropruina sp.]|uniref:SRPBCC domain-containing protein n=1 Tax=Micropruina sp. TaxID=2737536 RepID=UPI0039E45B7E